MTPLAVRLLALFLAHTGPGKSELSAEVMPECGRDKAHPTCDVRPLCSIPDAPSCAPPRWSEARGAWVRVESREAAARRYELASEELAGTAKYLVRCVRDGVPDEACTPVTWPGGVETLALAMATTAIYESNLREDIMGGFAPAGRGPGGEACVMQPMPGTIRIHASWLTPEQRAEATDAELVAAVLGASRVPLRRCFEVGGRTLASLREQATRKCKGMPALYSMWALYGTGHKCSSVGILDDFAAKRLATFEKFRKQTPTLPDWYLPTVVVHKQSFGPFLGVFIEESFS